MAGEAYTKRYAGGFLDSPATSTPEDSQFLNKVEQTLLYLLGADPTDKGVQVWDAVLDRMKSVLIKNENIDPNAGIAKTKLAALAIVDSDIASGAAIATSKIAGNMPVSKLAGYPNLSTEALFGDGSWRVPVAADVTNAGDKSSSSNQAYVGSISAKQLAMLGAGTTVITGAIAITAGYAFITATDASSVANINGRDGAATAATIAVLRNNSGSSIPFVTGGNISTAFTLPNGSLAVMFWDSNASAWDLLFQTSNPLKAADIVNAADLASASTQQFSATVVAKRVKTANVVLAYSASITPDASAGDYQSITITNGTAFTINNPTNPPAAGKSGTLSIELYNNSGGAHGTITLGSAYKGMTSIAISNGLHRTYTFRWNGSFWVNTGVTGTDWS